jgi:hypothetical protein
MEEQTVNIGDEFDTQLWEALKSVIQDLGGRIRDQKWGVAGSQELDSFVVELEGSVIRIESETYIGLTVSGDSSIVRKVQRLVADKVANKK